MKFKEFIEKVKSMGGVDTDGYYGKQCVDLYNYYCNNVLGVQNVGADCAKNILNNKNIMANVQVIENTPEFIVQKGDIVVFRNIGQYGHVAICTGEADINGYKCIEQNWSNTRQLEEVWHDYINYNPVFLRPKNQSNIMDKTIEELAQEVIKGLWGNGEERVNKLIKAGYNAKEVQNMVNELLNSNKKSVDEIAREVIAGKWGVGDERYQKLTKAGYDYNVVQARVNKLI